jgi:hypothetical protein
MRSDPENRLRTSLCVQKPVSIDLAFRAFYGGIHYGIFRIYLPKVLYILQQVRPMWRKIRYINLHPNTEIFTAHKPVRKPVRNSGKRLRNAVPEPGLDAGLGRSVRRHAGLRFGARGLRAVVNRRGNNHHPELRVDPSDQINQKTTGQKQAN